MITRNKSVLTNRFTTLNFQMNIACTNAGVAGVYGTVAGNAASYLRSGAYSFFDRMYITSQNGQIIEDITEYGLVNDLIVNLQMNNAVRHGVANQYGFDSAKAVEANSEGAQGINLAVFSVANAAIATTNNETHSFSIPIPSGCIGALADKMLNCGRTSKLQLCLQTSSVLPFTINVPTTAFTTSPTYQITLSNFSLQMEYIDIGINALQMLDQTLVDGKSYIHGTTYRTSSATLPASSGTTSLLAGIRASSVKSLFCRFAQGGNAAFSGKYDSFNPNINLINFSVGGVRYPQAPINPLIAPSQALRETQMAIGSFNNSQFQSCTPASQYCKLSAGASNADQGLATGATQDYAWNKTQYTYALSTFIFGENVEVCARRGLLSGLNATSAPIFVEISTATAPTNVHTMYCHAMIDQVLIHDVRSGDIQVRV